MADLFRGQLPASMFKGDLEGIIDAGDIAAVPVDINGREGLEFADGSDEVAAVSKNFTIPASDVWTSGSGVKLKIHYFGDSAGGGNSVDLEAAFEAISESDAHDLHAGGDYFAAAQAVTDTVDANAGEENVATITFTQAQADAVEPGDSCRIVLRRDSDDGTNDTYADLIVVTQVDIYEVTV